jgi:thiol-disulfide isomerase/thioredoxin
MTERLLLALVLIAAFAAVIALARAWLRWRDRRIVERLRAQQREAPPASAGEARPRIVYFTTESCAVCKAQQEPALERVQERLPDLYLERFDAVRERDLASQYGVLSVPTTAVYDRSGELVTINRGFTPASVLLAQLDGREPMFEGGAEMAGEPLGER